MTKLPMTETCKFGILNIGIWDLFGSCDLVIGIFKFGHWDLVIVWILRFGHWDFRLVRVRPLDALSATSENFADAGEQDVTQAADALVRSSGGQRKSAVFRWSKQRKRRKCRADFRRHV
jgi:hypothetical protein